MSVAELMPRLSELSRAEKVRVVETLVRSLAGFKNEDENPSVENNHKWWSELSEDEKENERSLLEESVQAGREGRVSSMEEVLSRLRIKYPALMAEVGV